MYKFTGKAGAEIYSDMWT